MSMWIGPGFDVTVSASRVSWRYHLDYFYVYGFFQLILYLSPPSETSSLWPPTLIITLIHFIDSSL